MENLAGTKFFWTLSIMEDSYFLSFCVYATFNCFLVFCASCMVVYWGPAAAGSGIPDVKVGICQSHCATMRLRSASLSIIALFLLVAAAA